MYDKARTPMELSELMLLYATELADEAEVHQAVGLLESGDPRAVAAFAEAQAVAAALANAPQPARVTQMQWQRLRGQISTRKSTVPLTRWWLPAVAALLVVGLLGLSTFLLVRSSSTSRQLAVSRQEADTLTEIVEQLQGDLVLVRDARDARAAAAAEAELELDAAQQSLREANVLAENQGTAVELLQAEVGRLRDRVGQLRGQFADAENQLDELSTQVAAANDAVRLAMIPETLLASLEGTEARRQATGNVVLSRGEGRLRLDVGNLTPPAAEQTYQAWAIVGKGGPVPLGTFKVDETGSGTLNVQALQELPESLGGIAVSLEPAGGVAVPSGPIVLFGGFQ